MTVAFADYTPIELESARGVPVTIWGPTDDRAAIGETEYAPEAMDWLEQYLGPYPFDTFGILIYDGESGMETQTMVTLGATPYATSKAVVVHELAHHWYGDTVTPCRLERCVDERGHGDVPAGHVGGRGRGHHHRREDGRLGDSSRASNGSTPVRLPTTTRPTSATGNIYFGPALMWHELRQQIGDEASSRCCGTGRPTRRTTQADRDEYLAWIEAETGEELTSFFDAWLLSQTTPPRD